MEKKEVPYLNGKVEIEVDSEAKERIEYSNLTVFPPLPSSLSPLSFPLENNSNNYNNNNINSNSNNNINELRSKSEEVKEEISMNESSEISEINNNKDNNNNNNNSNEKVDNNDVKLPMEILHIIIEKCSGKDLLAISQVNKQLNQIAKEINEKYQTLYLSSYFPMNKSKKNEFIKLSRFPHMYYDEDDNNINTNNNINNNNLNNINNNNNNNNNHNNHNNNNLNNIIKMRVTRKLPNSKINHKPNYASKLNRFSYFDPYYDHFYFWKDLYELRSLLENHQSNPCDWINDEIETVDIQSIEFFRIHSTIIKSNNGLQFNEVELVGITANLRPLRFLVRHGDHPLLFSSLMEQRNEFHQKGISFRIDPNHIPNINNNNNDNNNDNDNEEIGIKRKFEEGRIGSSTGRGKFGIKRFKKSEQEEINNNNNNNINNNNEQTDESKGKDKEKTNINTSDPYDSGSENDHLFAEVKDERMETHYCYHSRFPHCPCNLQDQIPYETYLWNFKKEKYSMLSRTAICRGCDECTIFRSNIANQLDKIIFVDNDFREKNEEKYQNWWKKGDIENVCLAAFAASTQNFGDYSYIKSN